VAHTTVLQWRRAARAVQLCGALANIRVLREHLADADEATFDATCSVLALQRRRRNVSSTLEVVQGVEEVHVSRTALQLLLDGQDYAGALDLLEVRGSCCCLFTCNLF
jgi:hypothetical protein